MSIEYDDERERCEDDPALDLQRDDGPMDDSWIERYQVRSREKSLSELILEDIAFESGWPRGD